jgi:competence protein ComEC
MGVVTVLVMCRGGGRDGRRALAVAVLVLLVILPGLATSIGFALSVAATAGLLVAAGRLARFGERTAAGRWLPPPVLEALAVTAAATLATLPLTVGLGNGLSLVSLPANLIVAPVVPVVTVAGLGVAVAGLFLPGPAHLAATLAGPPAGVIAWVARFAAGLPGSVVPIPGGWWAGLATAAILGGGGLVFLQGRWRRLRWAAAIGAIGLLTSWTVASCLPARVKSGWPPPDWLIASCDVGQGDATLIRVPGVAPTTAILVDAGPDPVALRRCLGRLEVAGLAAVFLTHHHADHIDGLPAVVGLWPDRWARTPLIVSATGGDTPASLLAGHPPPVRARQGAQFAVSGLRIEVLWPARQMAESPVNNSSLVLLVTVDGSASDADSAARGGLRALITGDVETEAQLAVMAATDRPVVDVVKVAHHGSPRQAPGFLTWSGARIALISVGRGNDYGHPAPSTIAALQGAGLVVGRTDRGGGLAVVRRGAVLGLVAQN